MPELRKLYQGQPVWPNAEGVPEGTQRKNHVVGHGPLVPVMPAPKALLRTVGF
ncbi:hypothetical protein FHS27_006386 [Rhodopirellula rubra]|uniref:Uncharacterized protein n=1 Tax=Aporhodopirellula rubra TaxID=980271 RepID=A0A7W5E5F1_9BACT|nr:hypothetical protein [Aporhodopirellula rubra]